MKKLYTAVVAATGGRDGHVKSSDGIIDLEMRKPAEMGGKSGYANPELLFAAAWGSCYLGALGSVGKRDGIDVSNATVNVYISFNEESSSSFVLSAELHVHIPNMELDKAQKMADAAHKGCPYSKATRGNIDVVVKAV
ncbi:peroxiredoxin, Ohr subfamily [Pseudopedobacter saltans DSM 12145]|uniref:Peroxiredoxin, Ohr subfamily n=1 Tax=Pseudopedobacter saltans (strain ATCC 51119 / DSM 12145 / JCM 21818 / CCUG 39354 / LMG 10337 / NBRC 100064 / NCIMB 13643) TaxID=762903 RepID=F0SBH3_PSESL|nr:Ohr family peroxiredoxin [Pseudopedobacter saltans]ADY51619.1 peroxiredoxin, Ohr subfamily [Pseudopedobacter saltans DSM 12145]